MFKKLFSKKIDDSKNEKVLEQQSITVNTTLSLSEELVKAANGNFSIIAIKTPKIYSEITELIVELAYKNRMKRFFWITTWEPNFESTIEQVKQLGNIRFDKLIPNKEWNFNGTSYIITFDENYKSSL